MFFFRKKNKQEENPPKSFSSTAVSHLFDAPPQTSSSTDRLISSTESTPVGFQKYSFPRPPRLSPSSNLLAPSSPSSPISRTLGHLGFDSPRLVPPASFVRHVRVTSGASGSFPEDNSTSATFLPLQLLYNRQRSVNSDLPAELLPVVNLMNAQKLRQYASGPVELLSEDGLTCVTAEATLTGTELCLRTLASLSPKYINVQDSTIVPTSIPKSLQPCYDIVILQDFDNNLTTLRFFETEQLYTWLAAIHLAKFESSSLQEAFTAVILSLKGPELSDIYTLLSHKQRFTRYEWSNLRLPQISNKWIKVFVVIAPGDNKKKGRIEVYSSDKITKKHMVLYVDNLDSIYNVYPEDYHMIDINLIMKLEGRVFVNKDYQNLFVHGDDVMIPNSHKGGNKSPIKKSDSVFPLSPMGPNSSLLSPARTRSNSHSSSSSFFFNSNSTPSDAEQPAKASLLSMKKNSVSNFVQTDYLYLMPLSHPGVSAIEIMLRNFIQIIDAFKLYGRPEHIASSKRDPKSMLFGLPALPHYGYLDLEDAFEVVAFNFELSCLHNWGVSEWRDNLKKYLSCKQRDYDFKGSGNIYDLFSSVELATILNTQNTKLPDQSDLSLLSKFKSPLMDSPVESSDSMPSTTEHIPAGNSVLGKAFHYPRAEMDNSGIMFQDRNLHPIADMPTPFDEKPQPSFVSNEGGIAVHL